MNRTLGSTLTLLALTATLSSAEEPIGFSSSSARALADLEGRYDALLGPENLDNWMKQMSSAPHHVGSPKGEENAIFMRDLFKSWGYEAELETYYVLFPTPRTRELELLEPTRYTAQLKEPALEQDATSGVMENRLPTYNAYSGEGEVTAQLVYVNQGIPGDYEELDRLGIDVRGKIVIARYGGSWRGIKPKVAFEHGAVACIIYSDPRDDGFFRGLTYPEGPFRPEHGVQRGSVSDMPLFPGDPLTPEIGATREATRLDRQDAPTLMKIPVLPISHGDALPLLKALTGPVAPESWRGALPITYRIGPGPAKVRIKLEFDWALAPAHNVIARLPGSESPDEWVVRGNHHDAWVFGAQDPLSGMVALLEEARAVGELHQQGWNPRRTIIYAAWDAEEPGLLGSTEWAEHHAVELREKAVAYINSDSNGRGFLRVGGSHTLEAFVNQIARDVDDPQTESTVFQRARAARLVDDDEEPLDRHDLRISPLGSGSDYTPFLQHLGIASLNIGFGGESDGGSYHSIYDSYDHYTRFGDPGFEYGVTLARVAGRVTLRLAEADVVPLRLTPFADSVAKYVEEVTKLGEEMQEEVSRTQRLFRENAFALAADPTKLSSPPPRPDPVPPFDFSSLATALTKLETSAKAYDAALDVALAKGSSIPTLTALNRNLLQLERTLTRESGLPRRSWFRHHVYAPGFYTGYGVKTLPGIREALEQRNWNEVTHQIGVAADVLEGFAIAADRTSRLLPK